MVLRKIFPATYTISEEAPVCSRNATLYFMRGVFLMGMRKPPARFLIAYRLWTFFLILNSVVYQPIAFLMSYISHLSEFSPGEFLTSLQVFFNAVAFSVKMTVVWMYFKRFDVANNILDEMDKRITQPSERLRIHSTVARCNRYFLLFMSVFIVYASSTFITGILMGRPPYQNSYPYVDWRASSGQLALQAALEYIAMLGACFQDVCCDYYAINFVMILRAHMLIFADRLRNLGSDPEESHEQRYETLVLCIQHHKTILRFADNLRPIISGTIFLQFLVVGLTLGLALINIMLFADLGSALACMSFMACIFLETFPLCILSSNLIDDCNNLADALFHSNWIDCEQRYKKTVVYFLQQLQQPIMFLALGVVPITMGTNISVTKFSFSVFTLVKEMNIAERFAKGGREADLNE